VITETTPTGRTTAHAPPIHAGTRHLGDPLIRLYEQET
jgi:hypothetical protein